MGKGSASKAEQANADAQRQRENNIADQQIAMQQKQLSDVNAVADPMIARGGMSAEQEAAMKSILMNSLPQQFGNIQGQIAKNLVAKGVTGGQFAGSGNIARDYGELAAMQAGLQQQGMSNIELQKAAQLQGLMGLKLGIGSQYGSNIGTFNSGATGALNAGVDAAKNADQAATSWMGPVFGALGSIGGSYLGGLGKKGCWIAAAVFDGWNDPRVHFVRECLWGRAENEVKFKLITKLYMIFGVKISILAKKYALVNKIMFKIFDSFMRNECDRVLSEAVNG